ncbi:hypothetical protein [Azospirillum argentinense]
MIKILLWKLLFVGSSFCTRIFHSTVHEIKGFSETRKHTRAFNFQLYHAI